MIPRYSSQAGREKYDIVTANILADVLVPLTPVIREHLKPGGIYITSGILDVKENEVKKAVEKPDLMWRKLLVRANGYLLPPESRGYNYVSVFCGSGADQRKYGTDHRKRCESYPECTPHAAGRADTGMLRR